MYLLGEVNNALDELRAAAADFMFEPGIGRRVYTIMNHAIELASVQVKYDGSEAHVEDVIKRSRDLTESSLIFLEDTKALVLYEP